MQTGPAHTLFQSDSQIFTPKTCSSGFLLRPFHHSEDMLLISKLPPIIKNIWKEGCHGDTVAWPLQWTRWTVVLIMAVITTRASCSVGCHEWSCETKQVSTLENRNNTQGMQEVLERVLFPLLLVWPTFFVCLFVFLLFRSPPLSVMKHHLMLSVNQV